MSTPKGNLSMFTGGTPLPPPPPPPKSEEYVRDDWKPSWVFRSHWKQPARTYIDTMPATVVTKGLGVNFNVNTAARHNQIEQVARLIAANGFARARIEIDLSELNYAEPPTELVEANAKTHRSVLEAFKKYGIRPLILLNANDQAPCPFVDQTVTVTREAPKGAFELHVESTSGVIPFRTGVSAGSTVMANTIVTSVEPGVLKFLRPLPVAIPAGSFTLQTLLYEPLRGCCLADGETPNPAFEPSMLGWLNYVGIVCNFVKSVLGSEEFDIEIWNELTFGSSWLSMNNYASIATKTEPFESKAATKKIRQALGARTAAYVQVNFPHVWVNNGFSNTDFINAGGGGYSNFPAPSPSRSAHAYGGGELSTVLSNETPLNALGEVNGTLNAKGKYVEFFTPIYRMWCPEYWLRNFEAESIILEIAPYLTNMGGKPPTYNGRNALSGFALPADTDGGLRASSYLVEGSLTYPLELWVTETNLESHYPIHWIKGWTKADERHHEAKAVLRIATAYFAKGISAVYFYATGSGTNTGWDLIDPSFWSALAAEPATYPGNESGGETLNALSRFVKALSPAKALSKPATLEVTKMVDFGGRIQFEGKKGTEEEEKKWPNLTNLNCLQIMPFQVNDSRKFVVAAYVMTLNISEEYEGEGPQRFDLPLEYYEFGLSGLVGTGATVTAEDPITGEVVPVTVVSSSKTEIVLKLKLGDYPRLITIQES